MYPKRMPVNQQQLYLHTYKSVVRQAGFLIPVAIFILVVMGGLALVIARTSSQSNQSVTQELLSLESFYAAESGTQRGLQQLFFPDASSRLLVDSRCEVLNLNLNFSSVQGLQLCSAQVSCSCLYKDGTSCNSGVGVNYLPDAEQGKTSSFYKVTSIGRCGQDRFLAVRTIEAGAKLEQGAP